MLTDTERFSSHASPRRKQAAENGATENGAAEPRHSVECTHCGQIVPPGLVVLSRSSQFCCSGCELAYELIHGHQLEGYYAICGQLAQPPRPGIASEDTYEEFDHAAFHANYVETLADGTCQVSLLIEGLHCAACVWLLEKLPRLVPGVVAARVSLAHRSIQIRWHRQQLPLSTVARRIADLGYAARPAAGAARGESDQRENRRQLIQLGIAGACAGNAMLVAVALYAGWFSGMDAEHLALFRWISAGLGGISLLGPGATFFRGGWNALATRTPHMDVSLSLGLLAGGAMGLFNTLRGSGEIYFDSLCMLVFVLLSGRYMQFRQQRRAAQQVSVLRSLIPRSACRVDAMGARQRVPVEALSAGDLIELGVGDVVPADGVVEEGVSQLDQSLLTGESAGIDVAVGDAILAGAANLGGRLRARVTAVGQQTRVGKLSGLVESAAHDQSPIVELAHRVSGVFLFVVLALAVFTLGWWWPRGHEAAIDHVIALLIVACPCALGLATPLTIAVALGHAAQRGILIRGGDVFERLSRVGTIWLDKTGTLTTGQMSLLEWRGDASVRPLVVALQQGIGHPIARSLVRSLTEMDFPRDVVPSKPEGVPGNPPAEQRADNNHAFRRDDEARRNNEYHSSALTASQARYRPGMGVSGDVDARHLVVGSRRLLESHSICIDEGSDLLRNPPAGATPILIAVDGTLAAVAWLGDCLRLEAPSVVNDLQRAGWRVGVLSGDHAGIVRTVGRSLSLTANDVLSELLPEEKLAAVRCPATRGSVVMVGDGVNDAAALAAADVGIAMHGGAEASLQAATVYLVKPGLGSLLELLSGSRRTVIAIRRGMLLSLTYNIAAVSLAVAGQITPLFAAVLMPLSSLSVIALASLQRPFGKSP